MAVQFNTGSATPVIGSETDVVAFSPAPGTSLDNISVYFVGGQFGGGGQLELALYATVGGVRTRVAQAKVMGSASPSIIDWQSIGRGAGETELLDPGGTQYTVTIIDTSGQIPATPRAPVTVTIAGVDTFDVAANTDAAAALVIGPGATASLPAFPGYAQFMDVAIDQTKFPARPSPLQPIAASDPFRARSLSPFRSAAGTRTSRPCFAMSSSPSRRNTS